MITADELRRAVTYNATAGSFARVATPDCPMGHHDYYGYVEIYMDGRRYKAHRLAWLYVHGEWPQGGIDHINGDKADNRIVNLRTANSAENSQNKRRARSDNRTSGVLGVHRHGPSWRAQIQIRARRVSLGSFPTVEEAHAAYVAAKRELHPFCTL